MALIIHIHPLSSPLLLRLSPHTFAFIPIPSISLSSRNRSNYNDFRHIMPCVAPVCEGMHYHKTGVPWQMKSTFIIILFLLVLSRNALFCKVFWLFCCDLVFALKLQIMSDQSRPLQVVTTC